VSNKPTRVSIDKDDCKLVDKFLQQSKNPSSVEPPRKRKTVIGNLARNGRSTKKTSKSSDLQKAKRKAASKAVSSAKKKKINFYANVSMFEKNPSLNMKTEIPLVAPSVNSLIFTRAVANKDYAQVQKLGVDIKSYCSQDFYYNNGFSNDNITKSSWHHAIDARDKKMIKLLNQLRIKDENLSKTKRSRVAATESLLSVST